MAYKYSTLLPIRGGYGGSYRAREYELGDVTHAIIHPDQPYDDDVMLIRWDSKQAVWTLAFANIGCEFGKGEILKENSGMTERAALVLLSYFELGNRFETFEPSEVMTFNPSRLEEIAKNH